MELTLKDKIKEIVRYVITGTSVTVTTLLLLALFNSKFGIDYDIANALAGFIMIFVAFFPYKLFVFRSRSWSRKLFIPEFLEFASARIFTYLFDIVFVWFFVRIIGFNDVFHFTLSHFTEGGEEIRGMFPWTVKITDEWVVKFFSMVITTVANYLFSKLVIFKKGQYKNKFENEDESNNANK
ncbi:MAG: GtrA family protein [Clostridia bacterium]|nr:GtrA family protein [Clostridia bacterium]